MHLAVKGILQLSHILLEEDILDTLVPLTLDIDPPPITTIHHQPHCPPVGLGQAP